MRVCEIRAKVAGVVADGAEVVVDDIEEDGEAVLDERRRRSA